jgi:hypothetical protein
MGDPSRTVNIPLYDSDYGFAANIIKDLYLGPGEPGPGDEWKFPDGSVEVGVEDEPVPEPAPVREQRGFLPRLSGRG